MLVLSRKSSERIHIGNNITVEVRRIAGNRVTLAIEAPRDIRILRGELEKAAKEFDDLPEETAADAADEQGDFTPNYNPVPIDALSHNDTSDHGMTAYLV